MTQCLLLDYQHHRQMRSLPFSYKNFLIFPLIFSITYGLFFSSVHPLVLNSNFTAFELQNIVKTVAVTLFFRNSLRFLLWPIHGLFLKNIFPYVLKNVQKKMVCSALGIYNFLSFIISIYIYIYIYIYRFVMYFIYKHTYTCICLYTYIYIA
jgi:hypothetical protein